MKRLPVLVINLTLLALGQVPLFAQVVADPNDPLYTDLSIWQERGLIAKLPPLRPYPVLLVEKLLGEVERAGTAADRARAAHYLGAISGFANLHFVVGAVARASTSPSQLPAGSSFAHYAQGSVSAEGNGTIAPLVSFSGRASVLFEDRPSGYLLPEYQRLPFDVLEDWSDLSAGSLNILARQSFTAGIAVGSDRTYFQTGLLRSSYGPFAGDNIILSPFAPESGSFSFTWQEGLFTYTGLLEELVATNSGGASSPQPGKYLFLHSLEFYPLPWLTFGAIESVVWGQRFEPLYLIPLTELYYSQGIIGFPDNSLVGFSGTLSLPGALSASGLLYVDDLYFNDLVRFDFNTKYKLAAQGGLSWSPDLPFLTRLSADYAAVMPYTYTHEQSLSGPNGTDNPTTTNWQNYTNQGVSMALDIPPDSDRISVSALVRPLSFLDLTLFGRYIRHGNASAGVGPGGTTFGNGTIFDPGFVGGVPTFQKPYVDPSGQPYTRFLTQVVLEKTLQVGFDGALRFDTPVGELKGDLAYTFEYIANVAGADGTPQSGVNQSASYVTLSIGMRF